MIEEIKNEIDQVSVHIEESKVLNEYTLYLQHKEVKKYVLSKYRPVYNLQQTILKQVQYRDSLFIVFGFAFGYPIEILEKELGENCKLIMVEPDEMSLKYQMDKVGGGQIINKSNVKIFTGVEFEKFTEVCIECIDTSNINNIEFVILENYDNYYAKYCREIVSIIRYIRQRIVANIDTHTSWGEIWLKNILRNRDYILKAKDVRLLKDIYKNIPAVIVSGGPSLDKNIEYLKGFKGVVLVGGRTVAPVMNMGIRPDFVCSIDAQEGTLETFLDYQINDLNLITTPISAHNVVANNTGNQYYVQEQDMVKDLFGISSVGYLSSGGSVATLCLSAAHHMGCDPIIFIGQDLAITKEKLHTSLNQTRTMNLQYHIQQEIPGYYGNKVVTTNILYIYLKWIEEFIQEHSDRKYINATEGGALIGGAFNKPFKEVVAEYGMIEKVHGLELGKNEIEKLEIDSEDQLRKILGAVKQFLKVVSKGEKEAKNLIQEYKVHKGKRVDQINDILIKLNKLERQIDTIDPRKNIALYIMDGVVARFRLYNSSKEGLKESKQQIDLKSAELHYKMYVEARRSIERTIEILEEEMTQECK